MQSGRIVGFIKEKDHTDYQEISLGARYVETEV